MCNALKAKFEIQGQDSFYAVNTHATAFATDDTKQKHIDKFKEILQERKLRNFELIPLREQQKR